MKKLVILAAMALIIGVGSVADGKTCAEKGLLLKADLGGSMNMATCFSGLNTGYYGTEFK